MLICSSYIFIQLTRLSFSREHLFISDNIRSPSFDTSFLRSSSWICKSPISSSLLIKFFCNRNFLFFFLICDDFWDFIDGFPIVKSLMIKIFCEICEIYTLSCLACVVVKNGLWPSNTLTKMDRESELLIQLKWFTISYKKKRWSLP